MRLITAQKGTGTLTEWGINRHQSYFLPSSNVMVTVSRGLVTVAKLDVNPKFRRRRLSLKGDNSLRGMATIAKEDTDC